MGVIIKTNAEWESEDPILTEGDYGFVSDTGEYRVGDGVSTWSTLVYPDWNDIIALRETDDFTRNYLVDFFEATINGGVSIKTVEVDYQMLVTDNSVFANCVSVDLDITLPNPSTMIYTLNGNSYSKVVQITKKDSTAYKVNILPYAMETIMGETSQVLNSQYENLTLISDGTNYYER